MLFKLFSLQAARQSGSCLQPLYKHPVACLLQLLTL